MKYDFSRYAPVGIPLRSEIKLFITGLILSFLYSTGFLIRYVDARNHLYDMTAAGQKILIEGTKMPALRSLLHGSFSGFLLLCLLALSAVVYHYIFHTQGSKSIYLMRRLPDKWELHRRCFALPVLAIALSFTAALVLFLLYYGIYLCFTPKICLPVGILS